MEVFFEWLRHTHKEYPYYKCSSGVYSRSLSSWSILGNGYTQSIERSNWHANS